MRQQYHFRNSSKGLLAWDVSRLIRLSQDFQVFQLPLNSIREIDESYWYDLGGQAPSCRNITEHSQLINQADLSFPIILCHQGRVMDGMHRVCKALMLECESIDAVKFEHFIEPDFTGVAPDKLPYSGDCC
ncbi:hypothetical protein FLL45_02985 [Aliikangiella marina]|uniref:Chromosome partitioning protein ParB n=1 Tax=Aliikangiella marina TaxID=1712262 RepID=A0A545TI94_9GAMM|nr:hypothetical protein [Aliikangiella marina]TQV76933.1 hypothetical protein FLL45_02985 [Aliikangiella marina]